MSTFFVGLSKSAYQTAVGAGVINSVLYTCPANKYVDLVVMGASPLNQVNNNPTDLNVGLAYYNTLDGITYNIGPTLYAFNTNIRFTPWTDLYNGIVYRLTPGMILRQRNNLNQSYSLHFTVIEYS